MPDQVFDVLGPDRHDWVRCQPPIIILSHYYDSQCTGELRRRATEEVAHTIRKQLSDVQAQVERHENMLRNLQEVVK